MIEQKSPKRRGTSAPVPSAGRKMHCESMDSPAHPRKHGPRRAWDRCAESLGRTICHAVDGLHARAGHLLEAPSAHVVAAALVGAAPSAIPEVTGVLVGSAAKIVSQTMIALLAAHASARILERAGHRIDAATLLSDAVRRGRKAPSLASPHETFRYAAGRLSACALDLVPGLGSARRLLEATTGALSAARFVALAEQRAEACVLARAARIYAQEPVNDNDTRADPERAYARA